MKKVKLFEQYVAEAEKFKSTKDFEDFCEEIDGMPESRIKRIMGKDYIDTPGGYRDEAEDYDNDIIEYMISNMGRKDFEELKSWWENNVAESLNVNEALSKEQKMVETFLNKVAKEFDYSIQDAARFVKETISKMGLDESKVTEGVVSIKGGRIIAHKVLNKLVDMDIIPVKKKTEDLLETIAKVITDAKMESVEVNEGSMSDIDLMAQEAKDFKSFLKEFTKTYHDLSNAGEPGQFQDWLKSIYNNAKENMGESVVTEGKDDFMARHSGTDIWLKKGYKHHNEDELQKLYFKIGELLKDELSVKSVSVVFEGKTNEAYGKPAGLSKDETLEVAKKFAAAISKADGTKCTVNTRTLEEDSFDLDCDGEEFDGGSYNIYQNGDVMNMAISSNPVYGKKNDTVDTIVKNIKKMK